MPFSLRTRLKKMRDKGLSRTLLTSGDIDSLLEALDMVDGIKDAIVEIEEEKIDIDIDIGEEIIYNRAIDDCINIIHKHT